MYLAKDRYEEIDSDVADIYEECGIRLFPVDPFKIAAQLQYTLVPYSSVPFEKFLFLLGQSQDAVSQIKTDKDGFFRYVIYYNDISPCLQRQRWSIAHEIGHIRLGHLDDLAYLPYQEAEAEANHYAKSLMAPFPIINVTGLSSAQEISNYFDISLEASGYIYASFLKWKSYGPPYYLQRETRILKLFRAA